MPLGAHTFIFVLFLLTGIVRYITIDSNEYDGDSFRSVKSTIIVSTLLFVTVESVGWLIYSIHMWISTTNIS